MSEPASKAAKLAASACLGAACADAPDSELRRRFTWARRGGAGSGIWTMKPALRSMQLRARRQASRRTHALLFSLNRVSTRSARRSTTPSVCMRRASMMPCCERSLSSSAVARSDACFARQKLSARARTSRSCFSQAASIRASKLCVSSSMIRTATVNEAFVDTSLLFRA